VAASGEATGLKYVADTQNTVIDAAGDLLYGTAADTLARLAIGTAGQVLTVNSGATAPQWAAPASGVPANDNNFVSTQQSTTSNSFTDLTTTQAVTVTTGTKALVIVGAAINSDGGSGGGYVGCTVSGASSISASTDQAFGYNSQVGSKAFMYDNLTAGSNTFTLKFRRLNATGNAYFSDREIVVVDMGS